MITLLAFLFVLGVLIFVHELGHFLVARWYGVRVLTFSLGFGPKLLKFTRGGTEYCISVVPLGGYVKLAGETVEDERTGAPDEFLSKSKWVRFQVYLAGPVMNMLLAVVAARRSCSRAAPTCRSTRRRRPVIGSGRGGQPGASRRACKPAIASCSVDGRDVPTWDDARHGGDAQGQSRARGRRRSRDGERLDAARSRRRRSSKYEIGDLGVGPCCGRSSSTVTPGRPGRARRASSAATSSSRSTAQRGLDQPRRSIDMIHEERRHAAHVHDRARRRGAGHHGRARDRRRRRHRRHAQSVRSAGASIRRCVRRSS